MTPALALFVIGMAFLDGMLVGIAVGLIRNHRAAS
jgi:hypothetical protein